MSESTGLAARLNTPENLPLLQKAVQAQIAHWEALRELEIALVGEDGELNDNELDHLKSLAAAAPDGASVSQDDLALLLSLVERAESMGKRYVDN